MGCLLARNKKLEEVIRKGMTTANTTFEQHYPTMKLELQMCGNHIRLVALDKDDKEMPVAPWQTFNTKEDVFFYLEGLFLGICVCTNLLQIPFQDYVDKFLNVMRETRKAWREERELERQMKRR